VFYSDFDPPSRTRSLRGLLGIVAAVLIGIGVTVYGYVAEPSAGPTIGVPETHVLRQESGGASAIQQPRGEASRPFQRSAQRVKSTQNRPTRRGGGSSAPSGRRRSQTAFPVVQPSPQPTAAQPTVEPTPTASPSPIGTLERPDAERVPTVDL
jgi:hypothetical protein